MAGGIPLPRTAWAIAPRLSAAFSRRSFPAPVVELSPECEEDRSLQEQANELAREGQFEEILEILRRQLASKASTQTGFRHSESTFSGLYRDIYDQEHNLAGAERAAEPMFDWYEANHQDPDVAALVARALQILAQIDQDLADAKTRAGTPSNPIGDHRNEARKILEHSRSAGVSREIWCRALFRGGRVESPSAKPDAKQFEQFLEFDPGNVMTYLERAIQLVPSRGGSYEAVESFAQDATQRTGERWGAALYAMIYMLVTDQVTLARTQANWSWVLDGFEDMLELFAPIPIINDFIRLAARAERKTMVRSLFEELPELRLDRWDDESEPFEAYAWANGKAPWPYGPGQKRALD